MSTLEETRNEIRNEIQKYYGALGVIDSLVTEVASRQASRVNNDGLDAQLEFLRANGLGELAVLAHVREATDG
jgi:hypothetical protein